MTIRHSKELKSRIIVAVRENHISAAYSDALLARMQADGEHHGYEHARARDWSRNLRDKHQAFAVVRNPWSRVVSRWTFFKILAQRGRVSMPKGYTFSEFLNERHTYGNRKYYWHRAIRGWYNQVDYIADDVDVLRLEHLTQEATDYFKLKQPLNSRNISSGLLDDCPKDYRAYYNEEDFKIVGDWYKADIDYFGFGFDSAATRQTYATD